MREIDEALDGELDYLFVATSTTGTLRGCCRLPARARPRHAVVAVDAVGSALFGGRRRPAGSRASAPGVETELSRSARVRPPGAGLRPRLRRRLPAAGRREAIFAGGVLGRGGLALERSRRIPAGSRCALIFPDGGAGYLAPSTTTLGSRTRSDVAGDLAPLVGRAGRSLRQR